MTVSQKKKSKTKTKHKKLSPTMSNNYNFNLWLYHAKRTSAWPICGSITCRIVLRAKVP